MTESNSTARAGRIKPQKPSPDFPLFAHPGGQWAKKVCGNTRYFGPWEDPAGALARWNQQKRTLLAGDPPPPKSEPVYRATARKSGKPAKPHKDFPLHAQANGQWAKKVRGRVHYFGVWADPDAALARWLAEKDDLLAGRTPRSRDAAASESPRLDELTETFVASKQALLSGGEMSPHTVLKYERVCAELVRVFGADTRLDCLRSAHFAQLRYEWAERMGVEALASMIVAARGVFIFAHKKKMIPAPFDYEGVFDLPSKKMFRLNKAAQGEKMFEAAQLRAMIGAACQPLKTMILLAINAGLGNEDVAQLPIANDYDIRGGWMVYPRPKTGTVRRFPLWPETLAAIREWVGQRPTAREHAVGLLFLTRLGRGWTENPKDRPITHETGKLLAKLGIKGRGNFYSIRRTFETIAGETKDQVAVDAIMGHDDGSMASRYRQRISDERLLAVSEFVRAWLFPAPVLRIASDREQVGPSPETEKLTPRAGPHTFEAAAPHLHAKGVIGCDPTHSPLGVFSFS